MGIVKSISNDILAREAWVLRVFARAPYAYKVYYIPKKNRGVREIAQPARETKKLQYWAIENILSTLPIHDAAYAYVQGRNIKQNAGVHAKNPYLAKFDIKNFFSFNSLRTC